MLNVRQAMHAMHSGSGQTRRLGPTKLAQALEARKSHSASAPGLLWRAISGRSR